MEAIAREIVDADEEVHDRIETLLLQSDNERITELLRKLMRMVAAKARRLSSEAGMEQDGADGQDGQSIGGQIKEGVTLLTYF